MVLSMYLVFSLTYLCILCAVPETGAFGIQKTWDYIPISLDANSSNENLLKLDMKVERIGRGDFALSGSVEIKHDFGADYYMETKTYRSPTGGKDYKIIPFHIKKQTVPEFFNTTYKTYVMKKIRECSNAPQAKENEPPVVEKIVYTFNKCKMSTDNLPSYMLTGYYKIDVIGSGPDIGLFVEMILEITEKAA